MTAWSFQICWQTVITDCKTWKAQAPPSHPHYYFDLGILKRAWWVSNTVQGTRWWKFSIVVILTNVNQELTNNAAYGQLAVRESFSLVEIISVRLLAVVVGRIKPPCKREGVMGKAWPSKEDFCFSIKTSIWKRILLFELTALISIQITLSYEIYWELA